MLHILRADAHDRGRERGEHDRAAIPSRITRAAAYPSTCVSRVLYAEEERRMTNDDDSLSPLRSFPRAHRRGSVYRCRRAADASPMCHARVTHDHNCIFMCIARRATDRTPPFARWPYGESPLFNCAQENPPPESRKRRRACVRC